MAPPSLQGYAKRNPTKPSKIHLSFGELYFRRQVSPLKRLPSSCNTVRLPFLACESHLFGNCAQASFPATHSFFFPMRLYPKVKRVRLCPQRYICRALIHLCSKSFGPSTPRFCIFVIFLVQTHGASRDVPAGSCSGSDRLGCQHRAGHFGIYIEIFMTFAMVPFSPRSF